MRPTSRRCPSGSRTPASSATGRSRLPSHPAELGELEAFRDLYTVAPDGLGARAEEIGGALCIRADAAGGSAMFNRVLGLGLREPATPDGLDEVAAFLDGVEWCVSLSPQAEPRELPVWLERRGLVRGYAWTKFSRAVADPPRARPALRVERVDDGEDFADTFVRGYGTPDFFRGWLARLPGRERWHCFVAYDGDEAAAAGALFVVGEVGWLGIAGTVSEQRGKGGQSAILAARIEAAAGAGCTVVVTETGEPRDGLPGVSCRNIVRAGFEPQYVRPNYVSSLDADTSGTQS